MELNRKPKNRPTQIQSTDCGQMCKDNSMEKIVFSTDSARTIGIPHAKRNFNTYLLSYQKVTQSRSLA